MATSGSYVFAPSLGELTLYAFNLCQIRPTSLTQEHMQSTRMASNLMLAGWSNQGVNLWAVDLQTVALVQGTSTYSVPAETITILDAYVTVPYGGQPGSSDRTLMPISRSTYASYPNKTVQSVPTVFWFDRLISPTITLWEVPDGNGPYTLNYYRVRQVQDANFTSGQNVEIPYRWYEAFADGLAWRLARVWAPALAPGLQTVAEKSYLIAAGNDVENVDMFISPMVGSYYRS